jgi:hypothetical protein
LRKGIPADDYPTEALRMFLVPPPKLRVGGVGFDAASESIPQLSRTASDSAPPKDQEDLAALQCVALFHKFLGYHLACMIANGRAPWQYHLSYTWCLAKNNGKTACHAVRLIHGILALAKFVLTLVFTIVAKEIKIEVPDNVFHVTARRREEAILVQLCLATRLERSGVSVLMNFRDTCNAYPALSHAAALDPLQGATTTFAHDILVDHVEKNVFTVTAQDSVAFLHGAIREDPWLQRRNLALQSRRVAWAMRLGAQPSSCRPCNSRRGTEPH